MAASCFCTYASGDTAQGTFAGDAGSRQEMGMRHGLFSRESQVSPGVSAGSEEAIEEGRGAGNLADKASALGSAV